MNKTSASILFLALIVFTGCSRYALTRNDFMPLYQSGDLKCAGDTIANAIETKMPAKKYTQSKDAVWLLLDNATIAFAQGNFEKAIQDYQLAIEAIDYYNQNSTPEAVGQVLLEDDVGAYKGADFEQVLARVYFALVLLEVGDEGNGLAMLRQAEEVQQRKRETYSQNKLTKGYSLADNPLAKFLLATLLEHRGDRSNSEILYNQTQELLGENLTDLHLRVSSDGADQATVIIVVHNGNSPYKVSSSRSGALASPVALEIILGNSNLPVNLSAFTGIPIPILMQQIYSAPYPVHARLCREEKCIVPFYSITQAATKDLQQQLPNIVARGVARTVLRTGTVACINQQNATLGSVASIGLLIANSCTQADTRSWTTLPNTIDLCRYDVPPGNHTLHLLTHWGVVEDSISEFGLCLKPNDFCVINVFNIYPGVATVQIPKKNINIP